MTRPAKILLTLSLIVNILLAGMLLGDVSRLYMAHDAFDITAWMNRLSPEKRATVDTAMESMKKQMDAQHAAIDTAKRQAIAILRADTFDEGAYIAQIHHIDELHDRMKSDMALSIAALARQLTAPERAILAEIISHPPFSLPPHAMQPGDPAGNR